MISLPNIESKAQTQRVPINWSQNLMGLQEISPNSPKKNFGENHMAARANTPTAREGGDRWRID